MICNSLRSVLLIAIVLLYIIIPFDIVPEAVFGLLGIVDDLGIVIGVLCGLAQTVMLVLQNR